jgi:hypothetical protein
MNSPTRDLDVYHVTASGVLAVFGIRTYACLSWIKAIVTVEVRRF